MTSFMKWMLGFLMLGAGVVSAQTAGNRATEFRWQPLEFLFGKWTALGDTQIGSGQGVFSFELELNNRIVVRHNYAEYNKGPAAGTRHDDLLVVYAETPEDKPRAIYFDSEGHVIRYNVTTPARNTAVFESDGSQPGPRYRLSYALDGKNLNGKFEIAGPGTAEYKTYLSWTSRKN